VLGALEVLLRCPRSGTPKWKLTKLLATVGKLCYEQSSYAGFFIFMFSEKLTR